MADYLRDNKLAEPIFIGTDRMESELVPKLDYDFRMMALTSPPRSIPKMFPWLAGFSSSLLRARKLIKKEGIDAVVCVGAYIGLPPGLAATFTGTPLYLMESNVNLGKANAKLVPYAKRIFTSYPETAGYLPDSTKHKATLTGNPLRKQMDKVPMKDIARGSLGLQKDKKTLLVMGGSLGALSINKAIESNLDFIADSGWQLLWQTGKNYQPPAKLPDNVTATVFIDNVGSAYASADLVICRSGATTCSEIKMLKKPAVLVPLPTAGSGEQKLNALAMQELGGAVMIEDKEFSSTFKDKLSLLMTVEDKLNDMASKYAATGNTAAKAIAEAILSDLETNNVTKES